ncbi:zinc-dependent alcohol dehydrogenase family protein [Salegentibacter chungangensis]|uniref:Zinc-dependent alcohol dehydrogenase family protein n=1 Tax=Salegentibacter chungangensis TaxID=1335724 RepID=A0ABW3NQ52_9FLAO
MKAMLLHRSSSFEENRSPLELSNIEIPEPGPGQVLIKVSVCGVCHTELDEIEGRTAPPKFPVVPGHQVVGRVERNGPGASNFKTGDRVGVAWIFSACGICKYCKAGNENLCDYFRATGRDANGGYAEFMVAEEKYVYKIPEFFSDAEAAPMLCAGAIGYRSVRLAGIKDGQRLGFTGFGGSAHLVLKMLRYQFPKVKTYVFARSESDREFALELGATWAGDTTDRSPEKLDAIIDTTPAWKPVVEALSNLEKGGRLVINAIRKEESDKGYLEKLSYQRDLWLEKEIKSVANVTAKDVKGFLKLAAEARIKPEFQEYKLEEANKALLEMKTQKIRGAKVLRV